MSHVIHRSLAKVPLVAVGGKGVQLFDKAGKAYIDASGGAAVSCLGHAQPDVMAAMHRQIDQLAYAHTSFFTTEVQEELADHLVAHAPAGMTDVYFVSGGSEAVEAALKMARQYFVEIGQPERTHFVARRQSYHGNTLGALAVGGNEWRRKQFAPILMDVGRVAPAYEYRDRRADESQQAYTARLLAEIDAKFQELGTDKVIAFVAEPVVGATLGAIAAPAGYWTGLRALCDRYGILLIADEVMCGMGRTGSLHAVEQEGISPDLMTIAKGLGGGYQPIGAVLAQGRIVEAMRKGSGLFQHGHTYIGHPMAAAAALAVQKVIQRDQLMPQVLARGAYLQKQLHARFDTNPHVGDIRGRGLFWGVELVQDKDSKAPFDAALKLHAQIKAQAMANGVLCYPMGGTIDGKHGDHILLAPPFIISESELDQVVERLGDAIDTVLARNGATAAA
ncbi:adenosylmethionine-8-amino-7-oxononanoate aminotransferase [Comamonas odontotermitis]|uniref:Adenosylmethionine-8-amino-7-oxononanoate aminotransferase n=1 Tax=Comamonas odontotermitis TaxID=379895 RepID=A0ABR6RJ88_9BURK|nr:aspartate aminotransferase family protein [Comamonas odontotermitis]MBB6579088.1 adenosylmethionine-8-amino-7-oxononanoate aminotransferase [Comamonas odontotermitis]